MRGDLQCERWETMRCDGHLSVSPPLSLLVAAGNWRCRPGKDVPVIFSQKLPPFGKIATAYKSRWKMCLWPITQLRAVDETSSPVIYTLLEFSENARLSDVKGCGCHSFWHLNFAFDAIT